jgi:hypothetical protein
MPSTRMSGAVAVPPLPLHAFIESRATAFCHLLIAKIVITAVVMFDLVTTLKSVASLFTLDLLTVQLILSKKKNSKR